MNKKNRDKLEWWREARFGMFIHWGLYSIPAGVWQGRPVKGIAEWIQGNFKIPGAEYQQLAKKFNPVDFDAREIVKMAKDTGMKYLVITAKHHDGFAMYDSKVDDYNIVKATPCKKDPMKALARECKKAGIVFCFYYSQDLDWAHPDGGGNDWDFDPAEKDLQRYMDSKVKPQLRELLTNYGPIGLIWFDMAQNITSEQSRELRDLVHSLQPACLVSGRVGHGYGDYASLGDNQIPAGRMSGDWECPATLNNSWGFKKSDKEWRSPETLLYLLVDLASKGVNYLLNIGPDAKGRVPAASKRILGRLGKWMRVHGEAIYGTQASPYAYELPWGRITVKDNRMFCFIYQWPGTGKLVLNGLLNQVNGARLMNSPEKEVMYTQTHNEKLGLDRLELNLPKRKPGVMIPVLELELDGQAVVDSTLVQQDDGCVILPAVVADVHARAKQLNIKNVDSGNAIADVRAESANEILTENKIHIGPEGMIQKWFSKADWVSWNFTAVHPGKYKVEVHTVAPKYVKWKGGHELTATIGRQSVSRRIRADRKVESPRTYHFEERVSRLGVIEIKKPGKTVLKLKAAHINEAVVNGLCVSEARLVPCN